MSFARLIRASFVALIALSAPRARADEESVTLAYRAPDECPGRAAFEREVSARTSKVRFSSEGRHFGVELSRGESGWVGTLSIQEGDAPATERTMQGAECDEVVSALALVAALAVDPEASTVPRAELTIPEQPPEQPTPAPAPAPAQKRAPAPRASTPPRQKKETIPEAPAWRPARYRAELEAVAVSGPAPKALVAGGAEVFAERASVLGRSSLGLGFFAAQTGFVGPGVDTARFRWLVGRLSLCPFGNDGRAYFRGCALGDLGTLRGEGRNVPVAYAATRFWADAGVALRGGYELGSTLYFELSVGALANLTRDRFLINPPAPGPETVYDVPFASFFAGLGAGAKIP